MTQDQLSPLIERYNQVSFEQLKMKANYKSPQHYPDKEWTKLLEEKIKLELEIVSILKGDVIPQTENNEHIS